VEVTNKFLESILIKIVQIHHKDLANRLLGDLWDYHKTWKNTVGFTPYELVYGNHVVFPIEFGVEALKIA